jgi:2,4-dienoyl-CoA reductase-like NADH-dependent reductase (Old Yellow Enzyme family)
VVGRSQLLREVVEGIERWIGSQFIIGVRLNAEEFTPGGLNLQDARLLATRLASAGVRLLEVQAYAASNMPIAHFPGWCVPMAAGIKAVVDIPVMVGGLLDDAVLADSVIRDNGADLISVGARMRVDSDWPHHAHAILSHHEVPSD